MSNNRYERWHKKNVWIVVAVLVFSTIVIYESVNPNYKGMTVLEHNHWECKKPSWNNSMANL